MHKMVYKSQVPSKNIWIMLKMITVGDLLFSDLTMKTTTYNCQTAPHISYIHTHTLHNKIKSRTLLKQIKFTKQTQAELDIIGDGYA